MSSFFPRSVHSSNVTVDACARRGNLANIIRYFPTQALNFAFKDTYKEIFCPYDPKTVMPVIETFVLGSLTSLHCAVTIYTWLTTIQTFILEHRATWSCFGLTISVFYAVCLLEKAYA